VLKAKPLPEKTLADRIKEIQAEAEAFIDVRANELKKQFPGLPITVLRRDIEAQAFGCPCKQALSIKEAK
jgi:hypothetical protein